jgi:TRAP-type C4-dicarboxylate transport system permease large subunit
MSFVSQLLMAFIIFGLVATISIGVVIAVVGKKQKNTDVVEHVQNRGSSF